MAKIPRLSLGAGTEVHETSFEGHNAIGADGIVVRSSIGRYTYAGPRCIIADAEVGRFCSIAPEVMIGSGGHPARQNVALHPVFYLARPANGWTFVDRDSFTEFDRTIIGSDVWLGAKAVVRDGITIGDGAIVGAGAVVVKDLEPYGVYAGVPARLIRHRFPDVVIQRLLRLAWWKRDPDWIRRHAFAFADVDSFLALIEAEDKVAGAPRQADPNVMPTPPGGPR